MWWRRSPARARLGRARRRRPAPRAPPRSPIACTCTWKPAAASAATCSRSAPGRRTSGRVLSVGVPAAVEVRRGQRRGAVLGDAVLHDLDAGGAEPAVRVGRARRSTRSATCSAPRSRSHHSAPTTSAVRSPLRRGPQVRRAGVVHAGVVADDRVLPAGDAQRVQVGLAGEQRRVVLLGGRWPGSVPGDRRASRPRAASRSGGRRRRARSGRAAGRGCRGVDARELERPAVDPGAVVVAVGQEHRPVGDDRVEVGRGRRAAGERRHRPAAAEDPGQLGVGGGVRRDRGEVLLAGVAARTGRSGSARARPGRGARGRRRSRARAARRRGRRRTAASTPGR